MGCAREGFNIFSRYGRRHAWKAIKRHNWRLLQEYILRDSLTPIICRFSGGHSWHTPDATEPNMQTCWWCHQSRMWSGVENNADE